MFELDRPGMSFGKCMILCGGPALSSVAGFHELERGRAVDIFLTGLAHLGVSWDPSAVTCAMYNRQGLPLTFGSLTSVELTSDAAGTLPVILSLIPLALTGSFYLRRDESEAGAGHLSSSTDAVESPMNKLD